MKIHHSQKTLNLKKKNLKKQIQQKNLEHTKKNSEVSHHFTNVTCVYTGQTDSMGSVLSSLVATAKSFRLSQHGVRQQHRLTNERDVEASQASDVRE